MKIALVAITRHGIVMAGKIVALLHDATLFAPEKFRGEAQAAAPERFACYQGKTGEQIPALFANFDAIVAVVSLGAVVRLIAPHLGSKEHDPAVVVVDEAGKFAIPILSGHLGGANALAGELARSLGAIPVLTTASDSRQTLAVDLLGRELGWVFEATHDELVRASAAVVNDEPVALVQEAGSADWWTRHANGRSGPLPANLRRYDCLEDVDVESYAAVLWISTREMPAGYAARLAGKCVVYRPGNQGMSAPMKIALGIGCDRGTPSSTIALAVGEALASCGAALGDVAVVASIDLKADEAGLLELARANGWKIVFYSAAELAAVDVANPSETVRKHTGTPSVSEAAALLAGAVDKSQLIIEKHRLRGPDGRNATVSIARIAS
ncbi:MAG: cobalamin [Proteobacteria bacterium]|nr:cobalamin [Pseudomonadota bacterium]